ncbi:substrate-binding domain-containing protein [Ravibacter arvi]|uniref:Substrate-binding domain-containing protein n=1 Tax=Ravibacter arvi TaxID=2051041 RepID=A0ABP8LR92_9BACT
MNKLKALFVLLGILLFAGCGPTDTKDNPTRGSIRIAADESFQPLVDALTHAYEGIYPNTHFENLYLPEQKAILALLQDSVRMVFVTRKLTERENEMLLQQASTPKTHNIAIDGVALITSDQNAGTMVTLEELGRVFKGEIKNWEQLGATKRSGPISLVFDDANSSNLLYLSRLLKVTDFNTLKISVAGSHQKVIEHVKQNPGAIGFIGMNWISDGKEQSARDRADKLYVIGVGREAGKDSATTYYYPFQEDLGNGNYPLARELYAITREAHPGLGGGLLTYIARDVGGLVIMKMGLVPSVPYHRDMILKTE